MRGGGPVTAQVPEPHRSGPDHERSHPDTGAGGPAGPPELPQPSAAVDRFAGPAGVAVTAPPERRALWWAGRRDLTAAVLVLVAMVLAGLVLGLVWYLAAPRLSFRIDSSRNIVPLGAVESEALIGADGWFAALAGLAGIVAGLACWWWRAVRGPAVAVGLAAGGVLGGLVMSLIGHLLGHGPSAAQLRQVGAVVQAPLELRSKVALIVEPFLAVAVYVAGAGFAGEDDLGRSPHLPAG